MEELPVLWKKLYKMQAKNVTCKGGIYTENDFSSEGFCLPKEKFAIWKEYLCLKQGNKMEQEAKDLLNRLEAAGELNAESLMRFHQEFMQMLYQMEKEEGGKQVASIFASEEAMGLYRDGMKSLDGILSLIHYIAENYKKNEENNDIVDKIRHYILNNLEKNITKEDITKIVHLNSDYITRLFKKETGMSVKSYIIQQKMLAARKLLQNTSCPISHIAIRLGYTNFSHFAATYKKQFGILPTEEKRIN